MLTTKDRSTINNVEDLVLFSIDAIFDDHGADALPYSGRTAATARANPVTVFGGRTVTQNYEVSRQATAGTTGLATLGRTTALGRTGRTKHQDALHIATTLRTAILS